MSAINSLGGPSPIQPNQNITSTPVQAATSAKPSATDRLELSGASHLLQALKNNDIRTDKVAAIKAQIASGIYDADGSKLDAATGPLLDELLK